MPKQAARRISQRRRTILDRLAAGPCSISDLLPHVDCGETQLNADLRWLQKRVSGQLRPVRGGDLRHSGWQLAGLPPIPIETPIDLLTADELTALIAARGLLRLPDARTPGWEKPNTAYAGDLSAAIHGLLVRVGLADEAQQIAPRTIGVSRFAVAQDPPGALAAIVRLVHDATILEFGSESYRRRSAAAHTTASRVPGKS